MPATAGPASSSALEQEALTLAQKEDPLEAPGEGREPWELGEEEVVLRSCAREEAAEVLVGAKNLREDQVEKQEEWANGIGHHLASKAGVVEVEEGYPYLGEEEED